MSVLLHDRGEQLNPYFSPPFFKVKGWKLVFWYFSGIINTTVIIGFQRFQLCENLGVRKELRLCFWIGSNKDRLWFLKLWLKQKKNQFDEHLVVDVCCLLRLFGDQSSKLVLPTAQSYSVRRVQLLIAPVYTNRMFIWSAVRLVWRNLYELLERGMGTSVLEESSISGDLYVFPTTIQWQPTEKSCENQSCCLWLLQAH